MSASNHVPHYLCDELPTVQHDELQLHSAAFISSVVLDKT